MMTQFPLMESEIKYVISVVNVIFSFISSICSADFCAGHLGINNNKKNLH